MAAALEEAEAKASALDLENARLRLALVPLYLQSNTKKAMSVVLAIDPFTVSL